MDDAWAAGSGALSHQISGLTGGDPIRRAGAGGHRRRQTVPGQPPPPEPRQLGGAIRSFSPPSAASSGEVVVMITASGYGGFGAVTETLPPGFSYVSSSLAE